MRTFKLRVIADKVWPNRCRVWNERDGWRDVWAPQSGGYVRVITEARPGTLGYQMMDGCNRNGSTLEWSGYGRLADLVRRSERAWLRYEQAQEAMR